MHISHTSRRVYGRPNREMTLMSVREIGVYVRWKHNVSNQMKMLTASENIFALTSFRDRHAMECASRICAIIISRIATCHVSHLFDIPIARGRLYSSRLT